MEGRIVCWKENLQGVTLLIQGLEDELSEKIERGGWSGHTVDWQWIV